MSNINWDVTVRFDPNDLQASASGLAQHGIKIPSYGNYGGPNYSDGVEGGTTPEFGSPDYLAHPPKDALDQLFYTHDLVYQHFQDGTATAADIFQADVNLVLGILQLPQTAPTLFDDPEARLYAGLAELTIASKILLTEADGFQTLPPDEQPIIEFLIGVTAPQDAIQNFELGLAETPGAEARSLNGAFHVFEAHSAQLLVQAMASFGSPGASESSNIPSPLVSETSQQPLLTIPQPA
jgi:hypothetical protein